MKWVQGARFKAQGSVLLPDAGHGYRRPENGSRIIWCCSVVASRVRRGPGDETRHFHLNNPYSWYQARNGADLIIISHGLFLESHKPLKVLREAQGYSVALIDVENLPRRNHGPGQGRPRPRRRDPNLHPLRRPNDRAEILMNDRPSVPRFSRKNSKRELGF